MPSVGSGVHELRVKDESGAYRSLYLVKFQRAVYILHVFEKRSRATSRHDIEVGKKRLKEMLP
jgi:phage-related protein